MRDNLTIVYTLTNTLSRASTLTAERLSYSAGELTNCKELRGIYDNILLKVGNRAKGSHTWDIRVTPIDNILLEERQG